MAFEPQTRIDGKTAVIAGGTGAIGLATARRLAALGANCVLLHRKDATMAEALTGTLHHAGLTQRHSAVFADITDSATLQHAREKVTRSFGGCDCGFAPGEARQLINEGDQQAMVVLVMGNAPPVQVPGS